MRKEPYSVGSYVHVFNRGSRRLNIVRNDDDRWRFLKLIRYLNDANVPRNWERDIGPVQMRNGFSRPEHWPQAEPYVNILAYCLMDNHFHLLVQERVENGITKFMQRVCTSMSAYSNAKYEESGTLFEGSFQARTVDSDRYLQYLAAYIHVKNPFECYPGGLRVATEQFDAALAWAMHYPFTGLRAHFKEESAIIDPDTFRILSSGDTFLRFARDVLAGRLPVEEWNALAIDDAT